MDKVFEYYNKLETLVISKLPFFQNQPLLYLENPFSRFLITHLPQPYKIYSIALSILIVSVCLLNSILLTYLLFTPIQKSDNTKTKSQKTPQKSKSTSKSTSTPKKTPTKKQTPQKSPQQLTSNKKKNSTPNKLPSQETPTKLEYLESVSGLYKTPESKPTTTTGKLNFEDESDTASSSSETSKSKKGKTPVKRQSRSKLIETSPPANERRISVPPTRFSSLVFDTDQTYPSQSTSKSKKSK
ncbi:hypothetical protein DLAC_05465 [Tieghemostelium lacteum]|uniref:Uncharacterized protein n=1 Tax=Tieghemostelium lacteum TaxID=361077 RepID=A0A151ZFX9_TIELA|nr:hypothetical protein DLAC_05465 [Tieghemostelium lacteum]|eukprot:KYQ92876.1 hypothetical protein DLAC_05465 [Tieghemostelium lacteum]